MEEVDGAVPDGAEVVGEAAEDLNDVVDDFNDDA